MSIAIFDIDGVVADVRHRLHFLRGRRDWFGFFDDAEFDGLLDEGAKRVLAAAAEHDIVWLTGRPEWLRAVTENWLTRHELPVDELYMRPAHDRRPAARYKLEALLRLAPRDIELFVDDDAEVVQAASAAGVRAVLAEWVPREDVLRDAQDRLGRT